MKIILSLLLIGLMIISIAPQSYQILKKREKKTLFVQVGIIGLAIIAGIFLIYDIRDPSIASLLNKLSPIDK
jgi:flagellar biosynthesis/type III secretory pathway M-ring protein FliF/YscJ